MKIKIKYSTKQVLIFVWIVFSFIYILWDFYKTVVVNIYQQGYLQGKGEIINQLIKEANEEECKSIPVFNEEKEVSVMNVKCFQNESVKE